MFVQTKFCSPQVHGQCGEENKWKVAHRRVVPVFVSWCLDSHPVIQLWLFVIHTLVLFS